MDGECAAGLDCPDLEEVSDIFRWYASIFARVTAAADRTFRIGSFNWALSIRLGSLWSLSCAVLEDVTSAVALRCLYVVEVPVRELCRAGTGKGGCEPARIL